MPADPNQVIVTRDEGLCSTARVSAMHAYHRAYPEIRAEGETVLTAAGNLEGRLHDELECIADDWRRREIEQAIADVQAYVSQGA
jgi:hypothetical protein